jgi:hypothetical protein
MLALLPLSGTLSLGPNHGQIGALEPGPETPLFAIDTGLKSSLTLFLLFMARHGQAP